LSEFNKAGARAVLVHINFKNAQFREELDEFIQLAGASDLDTAVTVTGSRAVPDAKFFIGTGKLEEVRHRVSESGAGIVIFNHILSPAQERNLERELQCRVLDRVGLILDIFSQRARSYEGKLQVELAQLQHLVTRLVRGWSHLERQKGGIGLRGPGETQLETDRRLIGKRIKNINSRLQKVRSQHLQGRRLRKRTGTPVVSLVGYTNAGKTTLFNRLTGSDLYVADKLFATLDTTLRKLELTPSSHIILSDTVGFIRNIPHDLIDAFHATLEEIREADLLLHVVDVSDTQRRSRIEQVNAVIKEIGAGHVPQLMVYNKADLNGGVTGMADHGNGTLPPVRVSARSGDGLEDLKQVIRSYLFTLQHEHVLRLPPTASKLRASLFRSGVVLDEHLDESGAWILHINVEDRTLQRLCRDHGLDVALLH
jgi:GTP-binding protein HflX